MFSFLDNDAVAVFSGVGAAKGAAPDSEDVLEAGTEPQGRVDMT